MLKERKQATEVVSRDFLAAETASDHAAITAARCVATMLQARSDANLPMGMGLEALRLASEGATALLKGRQSLVEAHRLLAEVRTDIGITGYGDVSPCPPADMPTGAIREPLRVVGA